MDNLWDLVVWALPGLVAAFWASARIKELRAETARLGGQLRRVTSDLEALRGDATAPAVTPAARAPFQPLEPLPSSALDVAPEAAPAEPWPLPEPAIAAPGSAERERREGAVAAAVEGLGETGLFHGEPVAAVLEGLSEELDARPPLFQPATDPKPPGRPLAEMLSEHGLVWAGGVALALGGLLMAGYAAQQGLFTPRLRIGAAWAVGVLMLIVGEMIRRGRAPGDLHPQAAALTTAAGAATLYGAVWAGHALYGLIGLGAAAVLLGAVSALLFALAFLHGQMLAWLAIGGAYLAPLLLGAGTWPRTALGVYLGFVLVAGAGASAVRRWVTALGGAAAGALVWALLGAADGDAISGVLLSLGAAVAMLAAVERWEADARAAVGLPRMVAVILAAAAAAIAVSAPGADVGRNLIAPGGVALLALTAWALRRRLVEALAFAVVCLLAGAAAILAGAQAGQGLFTTAAGELAVGAAAALAAWAAARRLERRRLVVASGALAAFALFALAGVHLQPEAAAAAWAAPLAAALGLTVLALLAQRRGAEENELDIWVAAGTASLLVAVGQSATHLWAPVGYASAALVLALMHRTLGWRSWPVAAAAAGTAMVASLLTIDFVTLGVREAPSPGMAALGAAALAALAARVLRHREAPTALREAVQTMAIVAALVGVVLQIRWWGSERSGLPLELLLEAGLYGLSISVSGLLALWRREPGSGPIARRRGPVLIALGSGVSLAAGLLFSPWWGVGGAASGAPVFNSLLVVYGGPAAVLLAASVRSYLKDERRAARLYGAGAALFAALWGLLETRRLFHGQGLGESGRISVFEAAAYALGVLAAPFLIHAAVRLLPPALAGAGEDLARVGTRARLGAVALSIVLLGLLFNPWWGGGEPIRGAFAPVLALAAFAAAAVLCAAHARGADAVRLRTTALLAAAFHLLVLLTLTVRVVWHGEALRVAGAGELETWTYSAVWLLFGVVLLSFSVWRGEASLRWAALTVLFGTAAKVLLLDLSQLEGLARAGSFLAVGALFIAGALLARRLTTSGAAGGPSRREPQQSLAR